MIDLLVLGLGTIIGILGFFIKRLFNRVDKMEEVLNEHLIADVEKYATKGELLVVTVTFKDILKEVITPLNRKLESIEIYLRQNDRRKAE